MIAARLYGKRDVRIDEVPVPVAGPGEVVLRVRAVSICPSDWRLYMDGHTGGAVPDGPIIQGHEFSGDIVSTGTHVASLAPSMRVAVEPSWSCGECDMCHAGRNNLCRRVVFPSFPPHDGGLAEYIACPAPFVCPLPDEVTYVEGALAEPLGVALHAVRAVQPTNRETVAVLGAGAIGVSALFLLRARRVAQMAVVEPKECRREWPAAIGASSVAASHRELLDQGFEADVVLECSGDQNGLDQAVQLAKPGGRVVIIGIPRDERIAFDMSIARRRELTVMFSRRSNDTLAESVELLRTREVDFTSLPYRTYTLADTAAAIEATGEQGPMLRSIVEP